MFIARVVGNIWATRKHPALENYKFLLIKPLEPETGKLYGKIQMAIDIKFGAGPGDVVLVLDEGGSARQILDNKAAPVRTVIAGVIDMVDSNLKLLKFA